MWGTGDAEDEDDVNPKIKKYNAAIMCNSAVEDCGATARDILANINGDIFMFVLIMEMLGKIEKEYFRECCTHENLLTQINKQSFR